MNLVHCMGHDHLWIAATVVLDLTVACGYLVIARHWWINQRLLPDIPAKRALSHMRNIFLFCGLCGYIFIPIKMFWPAWRLYDLFMVALAYFTWRYALNTRALRVVYRELGRSSQLEKDLEQSRDESRRRSWFLSAISHDLRTPLNAVTLCTDLAKLEIDSNNLDSLRQTVESIRSNAVFTAQLLDSLLDYARIGWSSDTPVMNEFQLKDVLDESLQTVGNHARQKSLHLRCNCSEGLFVRSDRARLKRILDNLLLNAVKFTEHGGVRLDAEFSGRGVEIHVTDTGCGIPEEARERVFDEFFQLENPERNANKGFGLGLAIARSLARQIGGDITLATASGRGSVFSVLLPGAVCSHPDAADLTQPLEAAQTS
jgi:signal transduction histidine kinase